MATAARDISAGTAREPNRYATCIKASKKVRWDIDADVIRGRTFELGQKFLPDTLSLVGELDFLDANQQRFLSQIQGRTYANVFGLVERYIGAKILELSGDYWLGDQVALEALVRFSDEELKHQELFRRIEALAGQDMPAGYVFEHDANAVARAVLSKSTWSVLALTCHIELFTQAHYQQSIDPDCELSELFRDVFYYHWREEAQHAVLDELEWRREDARLAADERDAAVGDLIDLVCAVDGILQAQASADAGYFAAVMGADLGSDERARVAAGLLKAYRWQYILSGAEHPRFLAVLTELCNEQQIGRIVAALGTLQ